MTHTRASMAGRIRVWVRRHLRKIGARLNSLMHPTRVDWVELLLDAALLWQAWRLWCVVSPPAAGGSPQGTAFAAAANTFLDSQVDPAACAWVLMLAGGVGLVAWLEEWTLLRVIAQSVSLVWWPFIGYQLCAHTPGHTGGGLQVILAAFQFAAFPLLCVQLDRERKAVGAALAFGDVIGREAAADP